MFYYFVFLIIFHFETKTPLLGQLIAPFSVIFTTSTSEFSELRGDRIYRNSIFRKTRFKSHNSGKIREGREHSARAIRENLTLRSHARERISLERRSKILMPGPISFFSSFLPRRQVARLFSAPSFIRSPTNSSTRSFFFRHFFPVERFIPLKESGWAPLSFQGLFAEKTRKDVRRCLNIIGYWIFVSL